METIKKNKESIINYLKDLDSYDLLNVSNEFSQNNSFYDNEIYINDIEFFELFFTNDSYNLAQRICFGDYHTSEKFVKFNGYGNLLSFNYIDDYIEFDLIAEAILNDSFEIDNLEFEN
jgi:hypothetical protein